MLWVRVLILKLTHPLLRFQEAITLAANAYQNSEELAKGPKHISTFRWAAIESFRTGELAKIPVEAQVTLTPEEQDTYAMLQWKGHYRRAQGHIELFREALSGTGLSSEEDMKKSQLNLLEAKESEFMLSRDSCVSNLAHATASHRLQEGRTAQERSSHAHGGLGRARAGATEARKGTQQDRSAHEASSGSP